MEVTLTKETLNPSTEVEQVSAEEVFNSAMDRLNRSQRRYYHKLFKLPTFKQQFESIAKTKIK